MSHKDKERLAFTNAIFEIFIAHSGAIKSVELVTELAKKDINYIAKFFDMEHDQSALEGLNISKVEYNAHSKDKTLYVMGLMKVTFADGSSCNP